VPTILTPTGDMIQKIRCSGSKPFTAISELAV